MISSIPVHDIQISHQAPVTMRDGTILRADIYRPTGAGQWPVILVRFVGDPADEATLAMGSYFSQRGYVFVYSNVRGTAQSGGEFFPLIDEAWGEKQDGYDTIEWAGQQAWSNGKVGLLGTSYGAFNQYTTAPTRPSSLKACLPFYGSNIQETVFPRGLYRLEEHRAWALWMALNCLDSQVPPAQREEVRTQLQAAQENHDSWVWRLPITDVPLLTGLSPWHFAHLQRQMDLAWWAQTDARTKFHEIDIPMLHVAGWYDLYLAGTLEHYSGLVKEGRSAQCRNAQRLVVGPWQHGNCDAPVVPPPLTFGATAQLDFLALALQWFDYWLKGIDNGFTEQPAVRLFLMGENRWLALDEWPPTNLLYTPLYLRQGTGKSAASLNNGHLTFEPPVTAEQSDSYSYDPAEPISGHQQSSLTPEPDQRQHEGRLLTYTTETLRAPVVVVGPVKAILYAASSALDTDWVVRLCQVWPDGRSIKVCDGVVRARFRHALDEEALLEPGAIYRYEIDMTATAQTFLVGHRIRVQVTSSDFPRYDRNLNTGESLDRAISGQVAVNTVFHDVIHASHVLLPILPAPGD